MLMREGEHTIAVGIYDELAAVASFITEKVRVNQR